MDLIAILTTTDSHQEARAIATLLLEKKLAACVQVSRIESFFTWDGALTNDDEYRLLIKTTAARYADVEAAIRQLHSYDVPAIVAFDLVRASPAFAEWVAESSRG